MRAPRAKVIPSDPMIFPSPRVEVITPVPNAMSGHLVVPEMSEAAHVLRQVHRMLAEEFKVDYVTIPARNLGLWAEKKYSMSNLIRAGQQLILIMSPPYNLGI
jgi:hypothetical protein